MESNVHEESTTKFLVYWSHLLQLNTHKMKQTKLKKKKKHMTFLAIGEKSATYQLKLGNLWKLAQHGDLLRR